MDKTDRIVIAIAVLVTIVTSLIIISQMSEARVRIGAMEVRLQKVEHMLSLSLSESRPSVPIGPTNGLPAFAPASREGADVEVKRRAQRKSGHYPPKNDRRTEGQ